MSRFLQGLFVGVGISPLLSLMMALTWSEEKRSQLRKRIEEQLRQSAQRMATKMRETGSALGEVVQQSGSRVKRLRQKGAGMAQQGAQLVEQGEQTRSTIPDEEERDLTSE